MYDSYKFPFVVDGEERIYTAEVYFDVRRELLRDGTPYDGIHEYIASMAINYIEDENGDLVDETPEIVEAVEHAVFRKEVI